MGLAVFHDNMPNKYSHITTATTTNLKTTAGILHAVTVNAALTGTITINDGASVIAVITNPTVGQVISYDVGFAGTLNIVTSATCDITVSYA